MAGSDNETLKVELDELTIGEVEDIEEVTGRHIAEIGQELVNGPVRAKTLKALTWILKRRDNPEFTLEDARGIKIDVWLNGQEPETQPDPPDEAGISE